MNIKVAYCEWGNEERISKILDGDCYILSSDNWDDYGFKTAFNINIFKNKEQYGTFGRKILFENQDEIYSSSEFLSKQLNSDGYILLNEIKQNYNYISLGYEYEELKKIFPEDFEEILKVLNDVLYLMKKEPDNILLGLKEHEGFEKSLCRDQSAIKVLNEGIALLYGEELDDNRFEFDFNFVLNTRQYNYEFDFIPKDIPHRINILIGKNGCGKSQTLLALSKYFLHRETAIKDFRITINKEPNFIENIMVFAYNQYETFNIDNFKDYRYFGFKRYKAVKDIDLVPFLGIQNAVEILTCIKNNYGLEKIRFRSMSDADIVINEVYNNCSVFDKSNVTDICMLINSQINEQILDIENPQKQTFESFKNIYKKDRNNYAHSIQLNDIPYRNKAIEFINNAFKCDGIALNIIENKEFYDKQSFEFLDNHLILRSETIHRNFVKDINFDNFENKLYFVYEDEIIHLSSGQQIFVDLVINLLSMIKKNSLVLIDEPENTLHPNLEIDFIKILKDILTEFDSFAIIATHSAIITREIPTEYVKVIKIDEDNQPVITMPTIKTFGADIRKITNYVFDDLFVDEKPFELWIDEQIEKFDSFKEFEEKYKELLNYNILLKIRNKWDNND